MWSGCCPGVARGRTTSVSAAPSAAALPILEYPRSAIGDSFPAAARTLKPAIVITEILVPGLDGLALCHQLKTTEETKHIPVVVFSVLAAEARAREAGAEAFLRKPLAEHRLVQVARDLLARAKPSAASDSA